MWTNDALSIINDHEPYTAKDGTKYPWNYPKDSIPGLYPVTLTPRPDDGDYAVTDFSINQDHVQVWDAVVRTEVEKITRHNNGIWSQIDATEREKLMPRAMRDFLLAQPDANTQPWYFNVQQLDTKIAELKGGLLTV
jgi:hypothetical protein